MKYYLLIVIAVYANSSKANVDLRTGNFYTTFTDIAFDSWAHLKVIRVYNAQSDYNGLFGRGWSSNFETHVDMLPTGNLLVRDYGGGGKSYFNFSQGVYESEQYGYEVINKIKDGFKRLTHEGTSEYFDDLGYLTQIASKSGGQLIFITYDENHRITKVSDNEGHILTIIYNELGTIEKITTNKQEQSRYTYASRGNYTMLTESVDIGENHFGYRYDENGLLMEVGYSDGSKMAVFYDSQSRVRREVEANGSHTEYSYRDDKSSSKLHLFRESKSYSSSNKLLETVSKEFKFNIDETGHLRLTYYNKHSSGGRFSEKIKLRTNLYYDPSSSTFD
jgi:YD repeat-containing protein